MVQWIVAEFGASMLRFFPVGVKTFPKNPGDANKSSPLVLSPRDLVIYLSSATS